MAAKPTQEANKQKGFNWISFLVTISIIAGIGVLVWYFAFRTTSVPTEGQDAFERKVVKYSADETDENYFKSVEFDQRLNQIYVSESYVPDDGGKAKTRTYIVNVSPLNIQHYSQLKIIKEDGTIVYNQLHRDVIKAMMTQKYVDDTTKHPSTAERKTPVTKARSIWVSILLLLIPAGLLIGFFVWMTKKSGGIGGGFSPGKNQARKVHSKKRFSDIAGQVEVKEEISEVVDFLKNPKKYESAGARIPKGILLGGPPGTGKTLFAKATAGEAGVPFFFISASNFVEMFAGVGAKRVREMFKDARKSAPAILFIDELDAIGRKRGSSFSGNDEREQTLNQILVEMDGMDENTGLLIIAATNRPDVLDPALLRPGRFDRTVTVNNPDIKEREAILHLHAKGKRISSNVDMANIAKRTTGYSGAQLENVINEATLLSVRENTGVITIEQIDEAIDRVMAGPAKKHRVVTKEEMRMVAYHEAGHAVIGLKVSAAEVVQKITIIPRGNAGGYTMMTPKKETYNFKKSELEAKIMSYMGGRAAEQIIYGKGEVSTGASDDIARATAIARAMVTQYGMSALGPISYERDQGTQFLGSTETTKEYSDALAERIDQAIRELILVAENKALKTINSNKALLELIAEELLSKETIVLEEIDYINKHLKRLPKREVVKETHIDKPLKDIISDVKREKVSSTSEFKADVAKVAEKVTPVNPEVKPTTKTDEDEK